MRFSSRSWPNGFVEWIMFEINMDLLWNYVLSKVVFSLSVFFVFFCFLLFFCKIVLFFLSLFFLTRIIVFVSSFGLILPIFQIFKDTSFYWFFKTVWKKKKETWTFLIWSNASNETNYARGQIWHFRKMEFIYDLRYLLIIDKYVRKCLIKKID